MTKSVKIFVISLDLILIKNKVFNMAFSRSMLLANFTCRFGDQKVLLDMFNEIVHPAFFDSAPRKYGKNGFYLFDLICANTGEGGKSEPIIAGKFVRDLELTRSHILRDSELVPDEREMESATSARFVLILSTHTLLYVPETPHAPQLSMFRSTVQYHLTNAWSKYIKAEARRRHKYENRELTAKDVLVLLLKELPKPELNLIELPSSISISDFLEKFEKIKRVEFQVRDTNHSTAFKPLIDQLRAEKKATGSEGLIIVESRPSNIKALARQLNDVVLDGNVEAKITGKGHSGETITGSNEHFRLSIPLTNVPIGMKAFVRMACDTFKTLVLNKEVSVQAASGSAAMNLKKIAETVESIDAPGR